MSPTALHAVAIFALGTQKPFTLPRLRVLRDYDRNVPLSRFVEWNLFECVVQFASLK